jgi:DNA-binding MarR family transcriptional regulator
VRQPARPGPLLLALERVVVASIGLTARALADVAPDLTLAQWRVIVVVDAPGGVAVTQIASVLGGKIAAVSRLLGRLRRRGLIATRRDEADARVIRVSLTEQGRGLRDRVVARRRADLGEAVGKIDVGADTERVLRQLAGALSE